MKRFGAILGILGILLLIAGGISYSIYQTMKTPVAAMLIAGLAMVLFYFFVNFTSLKGTVTTRSTKYGSNTALLIIVFLAIVVLLGAVSTKRNKRFDLTEGKRYSLSSQTIKVLESLKTDVKVTAFFAEGGRGKGEAKDLLQQYNNYSSHLKFEIVDPDRNPGEAKAYEITTYGTIVFESGQTKEKISNTSEEKFTNAILKVTRDVKKVVYFLKGHGEHDFGDFQPQGYSDAKKAITDQSYEVKELTLFDKDKVPEDASIVVIAGPKKDLFEPELKLLDEYIQKAGKLFVMIDPNAGQGLVPFVAKYGVEVGNSIIIDKVSKLFGGDYLIPVIMEYGNHEITKDFKVLTFFPMTRSVKAKTDNPDNMMVQDLIKTGPDSWAETDFDRLQQGEAAFDEGKDIKGPVPIGSVATIGIGEKKKKEPAKDPYGQPQAPADYEKKARLVVFGDSDFPCNGYLQIGGNKDLFLNIISWLAEEENLISIRPKELDSTPVLLSEAQGRMIFWFPVVIMPGTVILVGALVITRRRWRS